MVSFTFQGYNRGLRRDWKDLLGVELFLGETGIMFEFVALSTLVLVQQLDSLPTIEASQLRFTHTQIELTRRK
jgi:hypothetical protein